MLKYARTKIVEVREVVEVGVPDHWSMYSDKGNAAIKKAALDFYRKAENGDAKAGARTFLKAYVGLFGREGFKEASDTAVRESVYSFFYDVLRASGLYAHEIERLWWEYV